MSESNGKKEKSLLEIQKWGDSLIRRYIKKGRIVVHRNEDFISMSKDDFELCLKCARPILPLKKEEVAALLSSEKILSIEWSFVDPPEKWW
jgi:hypothetical protein